MDHCQKFLVVGLDGATFDWLSPLTQSNQLPHLKNILDKSAWGGLESTIPPFTATAWSSFMTGLNPGEHGILSFEIRDPYHYGRTVDGFVNSDRLELTLWETLNAAKKTIGAVNVPLTYPARPVEGYMVTGMMTPKGAEKFTYPEELANKLSDYLIDVEFIRDGDDFDRYINLNKTVMLAEIRDVMQARITNCLHLLKTHPTDFFMVVFTCTDRLSHFFWDELCEVASGELKTPLHHDILSLLVELDFGIKKLNDQIGQDAGVMLMSDHGFGQSPNQRVYLNVWLEKNNWLKKRQRESFIDMEFWRVWLGQHTWLKKMLRTLIPQKTQDSISNSSTGSSKEIIDWENTQAYFVPIYFHICGLAINTIDNRREGIVQNGEGYDSLCDDLINQIKLLTDPASNRPIVQRAERRGDLFKGKYLSQFPDIIVELDPLYVGAQSLAGSQILEPHIPFRSGEHRPDGIFSLKAPQVPSASNIYGLKLEDVAATICYAMNVPIPESMDAKVQLDLFAKDYLMANPIRYTEIKSAYRPNQNNAFASEEELIEQRLRGLGYLE